MNVCPIIDRVTRPFSPSSAPNEEINELCAADGWVDEGWKHVTSTLLKLSGVVFTPRPIIDRFGRSLILSDSALICGLAVPSVEKGPNFSRSSMGLPLYVDSKFMTAPQMRPILHCARTLVAYSTRYKSNIELELQCSTQRL